MSFFNPVKKVYKVGDKVTFQDGFNSIEYEVLSKRGAKAMTKHRPQSMADMKKFSQPSRKHKPKSTKPKSKKWTW